MENKNKILNILLPISAALIVIAAIVISLFLSEKNEPPKSRSFFGYFDTVCTIYDHSDRKDTEFLAIAEKAEETVEYYHKLFDIYNDHAGIAGIYEINLRAGEAVEVERELCDFLIYAKEMEQKTNGYTNIAMGAVLRIWHQYRESGINDPENAALPSDEELSAAAEHCDIAKLIIDPASSTVMLADPKMSLDVGAIGKGYAAEMVAEMLSADGLTGIALDFGGNIRVIGEKPNKEGFITGIKNPLSPSSGYIKTLEIRNSAVVTSGGYARYYTVNGKKYNHIINKDTLYPADIHASVTVLTENSALADALSTALFSMEINEGKALAAELGVDVVWVDKDGNITEIK